MVSAWNWLSDQLPETPLPCYLRVVLAAAATVLALLGLSTTGAAKAVDAPQHYVALGDSYASGPGIPAQRADPIGCQRSTHNYPALLAQALGIRDYTDVSCGGARRRHGVRRLLRGLARPRCLPTVRREVGGGHRCHQRRCPGSSQRHRHATGGRSRGGRGQDSQLIGNPAGLAKRIATVVPVGPVWVLRTSARWRAIQMPLPRRASVLGR